MPSIELDNPEFERLVQHAHQRLCGDDPLETWESELQEHVNDWFSLNCSAYTRREWECEARRRGTERCDEIEKAMVDALRLECQKRAALAIAELRECAMELVDGVCDSELKCKDDPVEDNQ